MTDTSVVLEMAPSDYTKEMWDKEFLCTFTVDIEADQLSTKMFVENKGEEAFDFQSALHSYFTVSSLENLEITGSFEGKEFLNKMVDGGTVQTEERAAITIGEEYDRVYMGVNDPALKDTGTGKVLSVLNTAGYEDTVLWNPYGDEGMGYNNFVCVESAKVSSLFPVIKEIFSFAAGFALTVIHITCLFSYLMFVVIILSSSTLLHWRAAPHGPETWRSSHLRFKDRITTHADNPRNCIPLMSVLM